MTFNMNYESGSEQTMNCLFVGNPGVGKSTLLNCLIKKKNPQQNEMFESGVSIAEGLTYQLEQIKVGNITFMDTPGLEDVKKRKQAAKAITEALKKNGNYQVFFVVTLEAGRVRPQDVTVINLVLESAKEITHYGVIFNKLTKPLLKKLEDDNEKMKLLVQVSIHEDGKGNKPLPIPLFLHRIDGLEDLDNVTFDIPELKNFMAQIPYLIIHADKVDKIETYKYEKYFEGLEIKIKALADDKEKLMQKMDEDRKHYELKMKKILENEQQHHKVQLQRIIEENEKYLQRIKEKEKEQKEEMKRLREEDAEKNAKLISRMEEEYKQRFQEMRQQYKERQENEKLLREEMKKGQNLQMQNMPGVDDIVRVFGDIAKIAAAVAKVALVVI